MGQVAVLSHRCGESENGVKLMQQSPSRVRGAQRRRVPPAIAGPGGEPVPPQHLSIFGRYVFELILSEDVDLGRYVAVAALLYGAGAACVGWTLSSLTRASSSGERASSLAARGLRTRGVGYRAGLEAPGRI